MVPGSPPTACSRNTAGGSPASHRLGAFGEVLFQARVQPVDVGDRWRERERPVGEVGIAPVEDRQGRSARCRRVGGHVFPRGIADVQQRQADRAAQALLRGDHGQVGLPGLEITAHAAEGRDRIDDQQPAVLRHHGRDRAEVVDGAAGGLAVHHADDGDIRPAAEGGRDACRRDGAVVGDLDLDDLPRVPARPVAVAAAEHPRHQVEHHVAGADQRGRGRLEADHGFTLEDDRGWPGLERLAQQLHGFGVQRAEGWVQVVQDRPAERGQGGRRRAGRPGGQRERRV